MSVELIELSRNVIMVIVNGRLTHDELAEAQARASAAIAKRERVRIIVITEDFQGWEKSGDWDDLSFQLENDTKIERMAIVGKKRWKQQALLFAGQGFRKFPIVYFEHERLFKAHTWVLAP